MPLKPRVGNSVQEHDGLTVPGLDVGGTWQPAKGTKAAKKPAKSDHAKPVKPGSAEIWPT